MQGTAILFFSFMKNIAYNSTIEAAEEPKIAIWGLEKPLRARAHALCNLDMHSLLGGPLKYFFRKFAEKNERFESAIQHFQKLRTKHYISSRYLSLGSDQVRGGAQI